METYSSFSENSDPTALRSTTVDHQAFQPLPERAAPGSSPYHYGAYIGRTGSSLRRVNIWDTTNKTLIAGEDAPLELNIAEYLEKHPNHEVYGGQSKTNEGRLGDAAVVAVEQAVAPLSLDQSSQRVVENRMVTEAAADIQSAAPEPAEAELAASARSLAKSRYAELSSNANGPEVGYNHSISKISQKHYLGEAAVYVVQEVLDACCEAVAFASDDRRQREAHAAAVYQRLIDNSTGSEGVKLTRGRTLSGELKAVAEARCTRAMAAAARATDSESPHSGSNCNGFGSSGSSYDDFDHEPRPLEREALAVGAPVLVAGRGGGVVIKLLANRWRRVRLDADGSEASFKQRDLLELNDGLGAPSTFGSEAGLAAAAAARAAAREASGDFSDVDDDGAGGTGRRTRARLAASIAAAQAAAQASEMGNSLTMENGDHGEVLNGSEFVDSSVSQAMHSQQLPSRWICCDVCNKWRRVPGSVPLPSDDEEWRCELNTWDLFNRCWVDEEPGALEPTDDDDEDGSSTHDEHSKVAGASAGHGAGLGRRRPADLVRGTELSAVLAAGADAIWALPKGRLVCWVEGRAYAVAHSGENLAQVARSFDTSLDDLLLINAAVDPRLEVSDPRAAQEIRLAAGAMLLLPWLNQPSQRLWHELTAQLLTDGWRLEWQNVDAAAKTPSTPARRIAYFPPPLPQPLLPPLKVESSVAPNSIAAIRQAAVSTPPPPEPQIMSSLPTPPPLQNQDEVSTDAAALLALGDVSSQPRLSNSAAAVAASSSKPFESLESIMRAQPSLLQCFELATPERALTYLAKAQEKRGVTSAGSSRSNRTGRGMESSRGIVDVLSPVFDFGSWVLARTSADKPWSFAKVLRWRLRDGKYDLRFEDGLWAKGVDPLAVRAPAAEEVYGSRRIPPYGRVVASRDGELTWIAYYSPPAIASPTTNPVEILLPGVFSSLADAEAALRAFARSRGDKRLDNEMLRGGWSDEDVEEEEYEEYEELVNYGDRSSGGPKKGALRTSSRASSSTRVLSRTESNRATSAAAEAADTEAKAAIAASAAGLCPVCLEAVARAPTADTVSSEEEEAVDEDAVLETVCCRRLFHRTCLESHVAHAAAAAEVAHASLTEGGPALTATTTRAACPACRNATAFHRQLRAARRLARFGDQDTDGSFSGPSGFVVGGASGVGGSTTGSWSPAELAELVGRRIWCTGHVCGVAVAVDRGGRLVLELANGAIEKARTNCLLAVAPVSEPPYRIKMPLPEGAVPAAEAWKAAVEQATLAADQAAVWGPNIFHPSSSSSRKVDARESLASSRSKSGRHGVSISGGGGSSAKTPRGYGPGYLAPGAEPGLREWACELCGFLNGQFARRCGACGQGSQAKSMVGRAVQTTSGPGRVAASSGKGWVVVETASGGRYRMRLSTLWDYTVDTAAATAASTAAAAAATTGTLAARAQQGSKSTGGASAAAAAQVTAADVQALQEASAGLQTASGFALPLPAQRAGDPGMPKNWSFSLLKKRVQTSHGVGVVTDVIDKGWIGVRLESGKKIKTRPGNVTALEGDEVIVSFAKKTKATHATRPPLRLAGATGTRGGRRRRHSRISEEGSEGSDDDDRFIDENGEVHEVDEDIGDSYEEPRADAESDEGEDQRYNARGGPVEAATSSGASTKHRARKRRKRHGVVAARRTVDFDTPAGSYFVRPDDDDDEMAMEEPEDDVLGDTLGREVGNEVHEVVNVLNGLGTYSNSREVFSTHSSEAYVPTPASAFKIGTTVECQIFGEKNWESGVVEYEHDDGTVSVLLNGSGDVVSNLPRKLVRRPISNE